MAERARASPQDPERGGEAEEEAGPSGPMSASARAARQQAKEVKRARGLAKSLLHKLHWQRIVLDEAHAIKDRRSSTAQAAFALSAAYRWCLSGTPLQNRVGELYSLVQFLQLDPYCYFFCKVRSRQ